MASVTASPQSARLPLFSGATTIRIEPPRSLFELRLRQVWACRELLYFFVWREVKIRYKQTAIGVLWVILQPVLNMLVFTLFFGRFAKLPSAGLPYPIFYFAALIPWTYFSSSLSCTTNVVVESQQLITKVYFPRLILPISSVLSGLVDFTIGFVVLSIFCVTYGILPTLAALWLPVLLLLALFTALGVGLWMSALNALYRDVRYVIPFVIQFWMFVARGEQGTLWQDGVRGSKGRFLKWDVVRAGADDTHTLKTFGHVTIESFLQTSEPLLRGTQSVALYNSDRSPVWGPAVYNPQRGAGLHSLAFPSLLLRPGPHSWLVSLFDDMEELDRRDALAEVLVAMDNPEHACDEWAGLLNVPTRFSVCAELMAR